MSGADPSELAGIAARIAVDAAGLAARRRKDGVSIVATKSSPEDIVTAADREVESAIRSALRAVRPLDGFLGEESGHEASRSGITWVVDPIDGTVNFLYGIPQYAVSIAAVPDDRLSQVEAVAGAVVNIADGDCFVAAAGSGARRNGVPIAVSEPASLRMALVDTEFSYQSEVRARQAQVVARLAPRVRDLRRLGAASLDLCAVASSRVDAYFEEPLNPWDIAAGVLIAREAGAVVTAMDGGRVLGGVVAAPSVIHSDLLAEIAHCAK